MRLCSRAERSSGDALRLMRRWGVGEVDARRVLARLQEERFIDDSRFAEMFTREKLNLSGWGSYKIKASLRQKGITQDIIAEVVEPMLGESDTESRLTELLQRKVRSVKGSSDYEIKTKLIRFALSRGFEMEVAQRCASNIIKGVDEDFTI
jgi:regulatory protein